MDTCGCRYEPILGPSGQLIGGNIIYCAKHGAAFELYDALTQIMKESPCDCDTTDRWWRAWQKAEFAIGLADGILERNDA